MPHLPGECRRRVYPGRVRSTRLVRGRGVLGAGNFAGEVELFYLEFTRQFIENKWVKIGLGLALPKAVGEASRGSL